MMDSWICVMSTSLMNRCRYGGHVMAAYNLGCWIRALGMYANLLARCRYGGRVMDGRWHTLDGVRYRKRTTVVNVRRGRKAARASCKSRSRTQRRRTNSPP